MICSKNPDSVMKKIKSIYLVKHSSKEEPSYYLSNDYKKDKRNRWCIRCKTHLIEIICQLENLFNESLPKKDTLMVYSNYIEEDTLVILDNKDHQQY